MRFQDLSNEAKEAAREKYRDWNVEHDWWDSTYEDAVRMAKLLGITISTTTRTSWKGRKYEETEIYFSGFWSQGDGACFKGRYRCEPEAVKKIEAECKDEELIGIAKELTAIQTRCMLEGGATVSFNITTSGSYSHSGTMSLGDLEWSDGAVLAPIELENELLALMRRFADWIYGQLESEHEYLTSDECLNELFADMDFDEDGVMI